MGSLNKAIEILVSLFKIHVSAKRLYTSINASRHILLRPNANITRRPCVVTCPAIWIRLLITVRILRRLTGCLLLGARLLFTEKTNLERSGCKCHRSTIL